MNAVLVLLGKHRPAVAAALAMLAAALLLAWSTFHLTREAAEVRDQARRARDRAAAELRDAQSAAEELGAARELLQRLEQEGFLAADDLERRQAQLRESQLALRLPGMHPSFGSPTPWPGGDGSEAWSATPLHLELDLLHEGDLPDFLARIARQAPLLVRECRLLRVGADAPPAPRLHADCELQWLSLRRGGS